MPPRMIAINHPIPPKTEKISNSPDLILGLPLQWHAARPCHIAQRPKSKNPEFEDFFPRFFPANAVSRPPLAISVSFRAAHR
jgi:hypothetical protein